MSDSRTNRTKKQARAAKMLAQGRVTLKQAQRITKGGQR